MIFHYFRKYWWLVSAAIISFTFFVPYYVVLGLLSLQIFASTLLRPIKKQRRHSSFKSPRNKLVVELKTLLESYGISCNYPPSDDYSCVDLIADIFGETVVYCVRQYTNSIDKIEVHGLAASRARYSAKRVVILTNGLLAIDAKRLAEGYGLEYRRYDRYIKEIIGILRSNPNLCCICGRLIDHNQKELCRRNSEVLGGKSLCHEHFKEITDKQDKSRV